MKKEYSLKIGFKKTIQNALIWIIPAALVLLTNVNEWLPNAEKYAVIVSFLIYMLKNYVKNSPNAQLVVKSFKK